MSNNWTTRKVISKLHLILGLATGLVVFIVAITGCLWVFKDEIESLYYDYKKVTPLSTDVITATEAKSIAQNELPNVEIHGTLFGKADEAIEVIFYQKKPKVYKSLFLNPYTGDKIELVNHEKGFFTFILDGHLYLWLPKEIGSPVVSWSVFLFMIICLSGIYLWWPKKKKNRKQRFTFDWNTKTRWKRKNYDLHTVVGFYVSIFAIILAFTGSIMAFNWFYYAVYVGVGGDKDPRFVIPDNISTVTSVSAGSSRIDDLIPLLKNTYPLAQKFELHYPESDSSSLYVEITNTSGLHYDTDYRFFDQLSLKEIYPNSIYSAYDRTDFSDLVIRMNYDIHIGAIGGIVGKLIAFLASLIIASMPVTGTLLWYGRTYKKNKKTLVLA